MIIGEAPGEDEDAQGKPFVGPAGELLDKIFASVGWDTNKDWYLGNVVKCRPIAFPGSGKKNFTPTDAHHKACRPYIEQEIKCIKPHTVVLLGGTAAKSMLHITNDTSMWQIAGKVFCEPEWPGITFFPMYHPAYLLHSKKNPERYQKARKAMWQHINLLKELVEEQEHA